MELKASTLYDIGDTVYAVKYPEHLTNTREWKLGVYEMEIAYIRVIKSANGQTIQYFLKGLCSYEGENWFNETPEPEYNFPHENIFPTREDAEAYLASYEDWFDEDED